MDWRDTVNWLRGKIDAPALTMRVVFADFLYNPAARRGGTTKDEGMQIVRGYMHITQALKLLVKHDGLALLFVKAAFPGHGHGTPSDRGNIRTTGGASGWPRRSNG